MRGRAQLPTARRNQWLRTVVIAACVLALPGLAACGQGDRPDPSPGISVPGSGDDGLTDVPDDPATDGPVTDTPGGMQTDTAAPVPSEPAPSDDQEGTSVDAELSILLTSAESDARLERKLVCRDSQPAVGSTVRDPEGACAALAKYGNKVFFELPDPNRICTQQYGGPQQAHVTGTFNGQKVNKHFSLTDGCKISEWNTMHALLGSRAGEA